MTYCTAAAMTAIKHRNLKDIKMSTTELNQFMEDIDEKVLECAICFERLHNPKSLNCLHSFCLVCLEDWVKKNGKLSCPTCTKSYPIPDGGLQKLPPNTFLNNLLETFEQYAKLGDPIMKCICGKREENYCQDCRHYLCSSCSDHHKLLPMSANHKLHTVEDVRSMTPQDFALLNPPLCSLHTKPLELYCQDCKTPICIYCTLIEHKGWEGKHKPISISDAFKTFRKTSVTLEEAANHFKNKLQDGLAGVICNATKLEQCREMTLSDIDNFVKEMIKEMRIKGNEMKDKVETIYKNKKQVNDEQMHELRTVISDVNTKLSFLKQLLKSDEATAMQSSETVIRALKGRIDDIPRTEPKDNGKIFFLENKHYITSLKQFDIGSLSQGQITNKNQLKAILTNPTGESSITHLKDWSGITEGPQDSVAGRAQKAGVWEPPESPSRIKGYSPLREFGGEGTKEVK